MEKFNKTANWTISLLFAQLGITAFLILSMLSCGTENQSEEAQEIEAADTLTAEQHTDLGIENLYVKWDYEAAKTHLERALQEDPGIARAQAHYAWYLQLERRLDESIEQMKKALEAEPDNPLWAAWVGWACEDPRKVECMLEWAETALSIQPDFPVAQHVMGVGHQTAGNMEVAADWYMKSSSDSSFMHNKALAFAITGKDQEARQTAVALLEKNLPWSLPGLAGVYMELNDHEQAISLLRQTFEARHPYMPWIPFRMEFGPIKDDPRIVEIFEKVGKPGAD